MSERASAGPGGSLDLTPVDEYVANAAKRASWSMQGLAREAKQGFARETLPQRSARGMTRHEIRVIQVFWDCKIEVLSSVNDMASPILQSVYLVIYLVFRQYSCNGGVAPKMALASRSPGSLSLAEGARTSNQIEVVPAGLPSSAGPADVLRGLHLRAVQ